MRKLILLWPESSQLHTCPPTLDYKAYFPTRLKITAERPGCVCMLFPCPCVCWPSASCVTVYSDYRTHRCMFNSLIPYDLISSSIFLLISLTTVSFSLLVNRQSYNHLVTAHLFINSLIYLFILLRYKFFPSAVCHCVLWRSDYGHSWPANPSLDYMTSAFPLAIPLLLSNTTQPRFFNYMLFSANIARNMNLIWDQVSELNTVQTQFIFITWG